MKNFFILTLLIGFVACTEQPDDELIDIQEIMPKSNYDSQSSTDTTIQKNVYQPTVVNTFDLESAKIIWDSVNINEELTIPERFAPINTEKFTYWTNGNQVEFGSWHFKDSVKSMSAFLNWMNCFGQRCNMIELRKNENI